MILTISGEWHESGALVLGKQNPLESSDLLISTNTSNKN